MFTTLRLKNFKSWRDTNRIDLAPITVFFGTNSSGKTSILQSLLLLKQTAETADRTRVLHLGDAHSLVDLGTPDDIVFGHDRAARIGYSFRWKPQPQDFPAGTTVPTLMRFRLEVGLDARTAAPYVEEMRFEIDDRKIGLKRKQAGEYELVDEMFGLKRRRGRPHPLPGPLRFYGFPDELVAYYQNADKVADYPLAIEKQLARLNYVGPLREPPGRSYLWSGQRPVSVGRVGENVVPALLAMRAAGEKIPPRQRRHGKRLQPFEEVIADWLKRLGIIESFEVRETRKGGREFEVRVRSNAQSPEVFITDVGFGVSQVLPVLVQAFYAQPHSTVLYEQPELHLHPSAQSELADAIIDASLRREVQFLIESHSEHFLRRLQRRIAEGPEDGIPADHVALYKCEVEGGASHLVRLEVDEGGNITNWPEDFFGDEMGDLVAMTDAAARRAPRK